MKKWLKERKVVEAMSFCLLPVLLYGIIGPLEIYVGNPHEFEFILKDFFPVFLIISVAFWLIASVVLIFLPYKLSSILKKFIFAFSIMSYLQNMFLNRKLMNKDGSPMDWTEEGMRYITTVNLIIWIVIVAVCFLIPFILKNIYKKIYFGITSFLSAIQIVAIISLLIQAGSIKYDECQILFSGENQFRMAQEENIIVLVLDSYHNIQFEATMAQYPDIAVALKDFTYYNNADAHYYSTYPSLAHMLTGKEFDYSISEEEWIEDCWQQPSCEALYDAFHNEGYVCDLYYNDLLRNIGVNNIENEGLMSKIDNIIETKPRIRLGLLVSIMEKMTIYKYMPYIMKPYFEVKSHIVQDIAVYDNMECPTPNFLFYEKLLNEGLSIDETIDRKFSFNYIYGLHKPWDTDSNGHKTEEYVTSDETSAGLCVILMEYIEQLKEVGAYDNATIIITADHGLGITMPQPLFLIKLPHSSQDELKVTSAPISHDDFLPTLLDLLGQDYSAYGTTIYDWEEGDCRTRSLWIPGGGGYLIYTYDTDRRELINQTEEDAVLVINPTE